MKFSVDWIGFFSKPSAFSRNRRYGSKCATLVILLLATFASSGVRLPAAPGQLKWRVSPFPVSASGPSMAVGHDGTLYGGEVVAVDPSSGQLEWRAAFEGASEVSVGPDETLFIVADGVYALEPSSGNIKWHNDSRPSSSLPPAVGPDGTVYVTAETNVVALNGSSGAIRWTFHSEYFMRPSPVVGLDGTVYVGSDGTVFYALDGATGSIKWQFTAGGMINGSAGFGVDGTVLFGSGLSIYALDQRTGDKKWEFQTAGLTGWTPVIGADGTVYVPSMETPGSNAGALYALDGRTGAKKWRLFTGWNLGSTPAIGRDGTLYLTAGGEGNITRLFALDPATSLEKWSVAVGGDTFFAPTLGPDGTVYVAGNSNAEPGGFLEAIEGNDHEGLADSPWPESHGNAQHTGAVTAPAFDGRSRSVVKAEGSALTWTVSVMPASPTPRLQWYFSGALIPDATNRFLTIASVRPTDAGSYALVATNMVWGDHECPHFAGGQQRHALGLLRPAP
jgi:outer membrane protein assembly factor BamB